MDSIILVGFLLTQNIVILWFCQNMQIVSSLPLLCMQRSGGKNVLLRSMGLWGVNKTAQQTGSSATQCSAQVLLCQVGSGWLWKAIGNSQEKISQMAERESLNYLAAFWTPLESTDGHENNLLFSNTSEVLKMSEKKSAGGVWASRHNCKWCQNV